MKNVNNVNNAWAVLGYNGKVELYIQFDVPPMEANRHDMQNESKFCIVYPSGIAEWAKYSPSAEWYAKRNRDSLGEYQDLIEAHVVKSALENITVLLTTAFAAQILEQFKLPFKLRKTVASIMKGVDVDAWSLEHVGAPLAGDVCTLNGEQYTVESCSLDEDGSMLPVEWFTLMNREGERRFYRWDHLPREMFPGITTDELYKILNKG